MIRRIFGHGSEKFVEVSNMVRKNLSAIGLRTWGNQYFCNFRNLLSLRLLRNRLPERRELKVF